jgi:hypothetical protein
MDNDKDDKAIYSAGIYQSTFCIVVVIHIIQVGGGGQQ